MKISQDQFAEIFKEWFPSACYFANKLLDNIVEAEDATIEVFYEVWKRQNSFSSLKRCKSFLYISIRNRCFSTLRHRKVVKLNFPTIPTNENTPLDCIIQAELVTELKKAVGNLPPRCKEIFHLSFYEGKSTKEIAADFHLSTNTVKAQKRRGLMLLRNRL